MLDVRLVDLAVDQSIETGRPVTVLGVTPLGVAVLCGQLHESCMAAVGAISAVPDLVEAEWAANGHRSPAVLPRRTRADGRSAAIVFSTTVPPAGVR